MTKKARNMMFVQQIQHLKFDLDKLPEILTKFGVPKWAFIIHDKDESSTNKVLTTKHIHCALHFENARHANAIAKNIFNDKSERIQYWDSREGNLWAYLTHGTEEAKENSAKHTYSSDDVVANFDYKQELKKIETGVKYSKVKKVKPYLQNYAEGILSKDELIGEIGLYNFAKNKRQIDDITELLSEENHKKWRQNFTGPCKTIYVWGPSGIGKSTYIDYLVKDEKSVVRLGSSNDYFQNYNGEHIVIINDLRPNDLKYADLLRLLDPWQLDKETPRRYHNRYFDAEKIFISSPYNLSSFYDNSRIQNKNIDTFEQLKRRIYLELGPDQITKAMKYNHLGKYKNG